MNKTTLEIGKVIGNWTIVEVLPVENGVRRVKAECRFCGTVKNLRSNNIAITYSCGCTRRQYENDPRLSGDAYPCDLCSTPRPDRCQRAHGVNLDGTPKCKPYRAWLEKEWKRVTAPFKKER